MAKFINEMRRYNHRYGTTNIRRELRRWRRHHMLTQTEKLERRYDAALFDAIGSEQWYTLYKLTPAQASEKGMI